MSDIYSTAKAFLLADPGVAALAGARIYLDVGLPNGYQVEDGPVLVISPAGGVTTHYVINDDTPLFASYASTAQGAIDLNEAVFRAFKRTANPAEATAFYAQPVQRGRMLRAPGDLYIMLASYGLAEVL